MKFQNLSFLALLAEPVLAATVTWDQPNSNNAWNTTASNWTGAATFVDGDTAIFDSATGETVTVDAGGVAPAATSISNNGAWTFSGGSIGGTLSKSGTGVLTLGSANGFTATSLDGGSIRLINASALGLSTLTVGSGAAGSSTEGGLGGSGSPGNFLFLSGLTGSQTLGNNIVLAADATTTYRKIAVQGSGSTTHGANTYNFSGVISGGGAGTVLYFDVATGGDAYSVIRLSNASNSFTGKVEVNRGSLQIDSDSVLGASSNSLNMDSFSASRLIFNYAGNYTHATTLGTATNFDTGSNNINATGAITLSTALTKIGSGTLTLGAANSGSAAVNVSAGTLKLGNAAALGSTSGGVAVTSGAVLDLNGQAIGAEAVALNGTGISSGGALINSSATSASLSGAVTLGSNSSVGGSGNLTLSGAIGGASFTLTKTGGGTLTLSNAANSHGSTLLNEGAISLGNSAALGGGTLTITATGTNRLLTTALAGSQTLANNIVLTNPGAAANIGILMKGGAGNTLTLGGVISGGGANTTLYLDNDTSGDSAAKYIIGNANTYSGKTYINRGSVQLNNAAGFGTSAVQFDSNANAVLSFGSAMTVANDISYTFASKKVDTGANDIVLSGIQTFGQAVTKDGAGALTLTRGNGGSSGITVASGTLLANNSSGSATGAGAVTVSSSGTLGGTGAITGAVNASGTLSPGASSIESLAIGNLTLGSGSTFKYEAADSGSTGADLLIAGSLSISGANLDLAGANLDQSLWSLGDKLTLISYTGTAITGGFSGFVDDTAYTYGGNSWHFDYNDTFKGANFAGEASGSYYVTMTLSAVPEPTSALAGGLCLAGLLRRRRNSRKG